MKRLLILSMLLVSLAVTAAAEAAQPPANYCPVVDAKQAVLHTPGVPAADRQMALWGHLAPVDCWDLNGDGRRDLIIGFEPGLIAKLTTTWLALISTRSGYRVVLSHGPYPWVSLIKRGRHLIESRGLYEPGDTPGKPTGVRFTTYVWNSGTLESAHSSQAVAGDFG